MEIIDFASNMSNTCTDKGKAFAWKFAKQQLVNGHLIGGTGENACKYIPAEGTIENTILKNISPFTLRSIVRPGTTLWSITKIKILNLTLFDSLPSSVDVDRSEQQIYSILRRGTYKVCMDNGWGDPHNYARGREIDLANALGHKISSTYSGADGIDQDGECEYKTTIQAKINGTYNGISVKNTWEEEKHYLENEKIGKYANHYFARYDGPHIVEVYKLSATQVLEHIMPKLEKNFHKPIKGEDPRMGATVTYTFIKKNGVKLELNQCS